MGMLVCLHAFRSDRHWRRRMTVQSRLKMGSKAYRGEERHINRIGVVEVDQILMSQCNLFWCMFLVKTVLKGEKDQVVCPAGWRRIYLGQDNNGRN